MHKQPSGAHLERLVHARHVGVLEVREDLGLSHRAVPEVVVADLARVEHLDRHLSTHTSMCASYADLLVRGEATHVT